MEPLVSEIEKAFAELERQLSDPATFNDTQKAADLGRRHKRLKEAFSLAQRWRELTAQLEEAKVFEADDDPEVRAMAKADRDEAEEQLPLLEEELRLAMVEPDPNDERSVLVEIRAGAGGDEAAIWAGDLVTMYTRFAEQHGMSVELLDTQDNAMGGYKDVTFAVRGSGAYSLLKFESGVHRVQRVPATESQGRIHTSTASVVVRPEADEVEVHLDPNDVRVDVFRSSGPGGQSVNTTDSAVRLTHVPTGIVVSCQNEKSQLQNKESAFRVLRARLYEVEMERAEAELSQHRKAAIGTGDRAEKIRTYNYPEKRVTDHRIKVTTHDLPGVLSGDLQAFVDALHAEERRELLAAQAGALAGGGS